MNRYDIEVTKGLKYSFSIIAKDETGVPIDLTGYSSYGHIKAHYSDTEVLVPLSTLIVTPASSGEIRVTLETDDSAQLPITQLLYNVIVYTDDDNYPILEGLIDVYPTL